MEDPTEEYDLTTEGGVIAHMSGAESEDDWEQRSGQVIDANNGECPAFWHDNPRITELLLALESRCS